MPVPGHDPLEIPVLSHQAVRAAGFDRIEEQQPSFLFGSRLTYLRCPASQVVLVRRRAVALARGLSFTVSAAALCCDAPEIRWAGLWIAG